MKLQLKLDIIEIVTVDNNDQKEYMVIGKTNDTSYLYDPVSKIIGHCLTKYTKVVDTNR